VISNPTISGGAFAVFNGAIVGGAITFAGSGGTLQIGGTALPNTIYGFAPGHTIDLIAIAFVGGSVTLGTGNVLWVAEAG
jgi:hypothetical protein